MASIEEKMVKIGEPVNKRLKVLFEDKKTPREVYGLLREFLSLQGKLVRPVLCMTCCEAVGGNQEAAIPAASAIEMFHNFTLIHDDIEDCSKKRRGKPCLHVKYGIPLAINAGDGLFMMVWQEALRIKGEKKEAAQKKMLSAFTKVLEGQAMELGWYQNNYWNADEKEYFEVVGGKTGALIAVSCEVGALLGGADEKTCKSLYDFGMNLGIGFQIVDDVLNIAGDEKKYGKEIGGDIREGKRTLMTIKAIRTLASQKKVRLVELLKKGNKSENDIAEVISLLKESGSVGEALNEAERRVRLAMSNLECLEDNEAKRNLVEVAKFITERNK